MVAIATLLPKERPTLRVLLVSVCTWLLMCASLSLSFAAQLSALPLLWLWGDATARSYWLGWLLRCAALPFTGLHPLWRVRVVAGEAPLTWTRWWEALREGTVVASSPLPDRVLIVCNHVSDLDPFITARALLPLEHKYIAKGSHAAADDRAPLHVNDRRLSHAQRSAHTAPLPSPALLQCEPRSRGFRSRRHGRAARDSWPLSCDPSPAVACARLRLSDPPLRPRIARC